MRQTSPENKAAQFLRKGLPERRKHRMVAKKERRPLKAGTLFLWVLFFATLFYTAFFSTFFLIALPQMTGMNAVPETTLRGFVDAELSRKYFGIFSRRNFFFVRPKNLEEQIRLRFPLLASVSVTRVFPNNLRVAVVERDKIILWYSLGQSYLIDEEGVAHDSKEALLPENSQYILSITDMSQDPVALGERVFDAGYGNFVIQMDALFSLQLGITLAPQYTTVSHFADELRVKTDEGWEAYFGTDIPIESSLGVLKLLFEKELPPEKRAKLSYIDLRTENRAFYAFREGENVEDLTAVSSPPSQSDKKTDVHSKKKKKK